jgi:DUF1680 family protein
MLYSYPLGEGVSKPTSVSSGGIGYGSEFDSFWCCYTTAIDQWTKMSDSIYFFENQNGVPSLYINLFVASQVDWYEQQHVSIRQMTAFPRETTTALTLTTSIDAVPLNIYLRVPSWIVTSESWIEINGIRQQIELIPSTYVLLSTTQWKTNDRIVYNMAMQVHAEPINDNPQLASILFGPIVLAGLTKQAKTLPRDMNLIRRANSTVQEPLQFEATALDGSIFRLLPLYEIVNETYTVYFPLG